MEENIEMVAARLHYLLGSAFTWKSYHKPSDVWSHDHCQVCWRTIAESEGEDVIHTGYASTANAKWKADYHWICPECFERHKGHMRWAVVT